MTRSQGASGLGSWLGQTLGRHSRAGFLLFHWNWHLTVASCAWHVWVNSWQVHGMACHFVVAILALALWRLAFLLNGVLILIILAQWPLRTGFWTLCSCSSSPSPSPSCYYSCRARWGAWVWRSGSVGGSYGASTTGGWSSAVDFSASKSLLRNKCLHAWRTKRLHHSLSFWKMAKHIYLSPWRCDHSRAEPGRKVWISGVLNMEAKHLHHTPRRCHYSNADPRGWGKASIIQYLEDWQWWMFLGKKYSPEI